MNAASIAGRPDASNSSSGSCFRATRISRTSGLTKAAVSAAESGSVAHASGKAPAFSAGVPTAMPAFSASAMTADAYCWSISSAPESRTAAQRAREQEAVVGDALDVVDPLARQRALVAELFPLPAVVGGEHVHAVRVQRHQ